MIYFIQRITGGPIKIGTTIALRSRLSALTTKHRATLKVLGVMPGDRKTEFSLHAHFSELRISGEWFKAEPELLAFIKENADPWDRIERESSKSAGSEYVSLATVARILNVNRVWLAGYVSGLELPTKEIARRVAIRRIDIQKIEIPARLGRNNVAPSS